MVVFRSEESPLNWSEVRRKEWIDCWVDVYTPLHVSGLLRQSSTTLHPPEPCHQGCLYTYMMGGTHDNACHNIHSPWPLPLHRSNARSERDESDMPYFVSFFEYFSGRGAFHNEWSTHQFLLSHTNLALINVKSSESPLGTYAHTYLELRHYSCEMVPLCGWTTVSNDPMSNRVGNARGILRIILSCI